MHFTWERKDRKKIDQDKMADITKVLAGTGFDIRGGVSTEGQICS